MKLQDSESAIPFDELIKEMFDNRDNLTYLQALQQYISKRKKDYCLVRSYALQHTIYGYIQQAKLSKL